MSPDQVIWGFKAIKPFDAEHPIGSGEMVHYAPGDEVPASEWGRAEGFMVEAGTIMRYARNVSEVLDPLPAPVAASSLDEAVAVPSEAPAEPPAAEEAVAVAADGEESAAEEALVAEDGDEAVAAEGEPFPQKQAAGWYLLSNGEKAHGKAAALAAQAELDVAAEAAAAPVEATG